MDSDSEHDVEGDRSWKENHRNNETKGANCSVASKNVVLKSFKPSYVTMKEEVEEDQVNCDNSKKYKEKSDKLRSSSDDENEPQDTSVNSLMEQDEINAIKLKNKALERDIQVLKARDNLKRQAVQTVNKRLSRCNEDLQKHKLTVSHQKRELKMCREHLEKKDSLLRALEEELQIEHRLTCQLKAQLTRTETRCQEYCEWQEKERRLEEEKEELQNSNAALQADLMEMLKQKKHDKEVVSMLLDQLEEANAKINASSPEQSPRNVLVLGDTNAYGIGQILERTYLINARFEALHHTRQLLDFAKSCPPVLKKSDQILIHVGTSDITRGLSANQIVYDIGKAVLRISEQSTTPIMIATIPPVKTHAKHDIEARLLNRYLTEIEKVTVLDIYEDSEPSLAGDGYHLTKSAINRVAARLADKMDLVRTTAQTRSRAEDIPPSDTEWESTPKKRSRFMNDDSEDDLSQHTSQRDRSPERNDQTSQSEQSPEQSETENTCNYVRHEERKRKIEVKIRTEDIGHVIGKNGRNLNRLTDNYRVEIRPKDDGRILIVGERRDAEKAARDIEDTINRIQHYRKRGSAGSPVAETGFPRFC